MAQLLPKACIIMDAGASHDVWNTASVKNESTDLWRPSLASELFDMGAKPAFAPILHRYPGAEYLASVLGPLAESGGVRLLSPCVSNGQLGSFDGKFLHRDRQAL